MWVVTVDILRLYFVEILFLEGGLIGNSILGIVLSSITLSSPFESKGKLSSLTFIAFWEDLELKLSLSLMFEGCLTNVYWLFVFVFWGLGIQNCPNSLLLKGELVNL